MFRTLFHTFLLLALTVSFFGSATAQVSPESYETWKANHPHARTNGSRAIIGISNDDVEIRVDDENGKFVIGTTDGARLLYGFPDNIWSSHTNVRFDGVMYSNEPSLGIELQWESSTTNPQVIGDTIQSTWAIGQVLIHQTFELVEFSNRGAIRIRYLIENNDSASHSVGVLIEMDTQVNFNDATPIADGDNYSVIVRDFEGADMPSYWQAFEYEIDHPNFPGLIGQGELVGSQAVPPDRFAIGAWPSFNSVVWDYTVPDNVTYGDSAVLLWWYPVTVAPGGSVEFITLYGTGDVNYSPGELILTLSAPDALETINCQYSPNPFAVNVIVNNTNSTTVNNVMGTINLPTGLELAAGETMTKSVNPSSLGPGESGTVTWQVRALPTSQPETYTLSVDVAADGTDPNSVDHQIFVPGAPTTLTIPFDEHNFGNVAWGEPSVWPMLLSNTTPQDIDIVDVESSIPDFGYDTETISLPYTIPSCAAIPFPVVCSPTQPGPLNGTLTLYSSQGQAHVIDLSANGQTAIISLSEPSHDFGEVIVNTSETWTLQISNNGVVPLYITDIEVFGVVFDAEPPQDYPVTIPPGGSLPFLVSFEPLQELYYSGVLTIHSNSFNEQELDVNLSGRGVKPQLHVNNTPFDFGSVPVNETATLPITLHNNGTGTLIIESIEVNDDHFASPFMAQTPLEIEQDQSVTSELTFTPSAPQNYTALMTLNSNDPDTPQYYVQLIGNGLGALIVIQPDDEYDFGQVPLGQTVSAELTLQNPGNEPLTVDAIALNHPDLVVSTPDAFPITITPGATAPLTIDYEPTTTGSWDATTVVTNSSVNAPQKAIQLHGEGVSASLLASSDFDFGDVPIETTDTAAVWLKNAGQFATTLQAMTTDSPIFTVIAPVLPYTLAVQDSVQILLQANPEIPGPIDDVLTITATNVGDFTPQIDITGEATAPELTPNQTTLDFEAVPVGTVDTIDLVLSNSGTHLLNIWEFSFSNPAFSLSDSPDFPLQIGPAQAQTVAIAFTPTEPIDYTAALTISSDAYTQPQTVISLLGLGVAPEIVLSATEHDFGFIPVGTTQPWSLQISNEGTHEMLISGITTTHPVFSTQSLNYPVSVPVGEAINVDVFFTPAQEQTYVGEVIINSNSFVNPIQTVGVNGTGAAPDVELNAIAYDFGSVHLTAFADWTLVVQNAGTAAFNLQNVTSDSPDFVVLEPLSHPVLLQPNQSQEMVIRFDPTAKGPRSGTLTITTDAEATPREVALTGLAVAQDIQVPALVEFGDVFVGTTQDQEVTIANIGTADLTITDWSVESGTFSLFNPPPLPIVLEPNTQLALTVRFTPQEPGAFSTNLTVVSNDLETPVSTVTLTASALGGQDIEITDLVHDFGALPLDEHLDWTFDIENVGLYDLVVSDIISDRDDFTIIVPLRELNLVIGPGESAAVIVRFQPVSGGFIGGQIDVYSDDYDEQIVSLTVSGIGVAPEINLTEDTLDFGAVNVNHSADMSMFIDNVGVSPLTIQQITVDQPAFELSPEIEFPVTIAPLETFSVPLTFTPTQAGEYNATLLINNSDADENPLPVMLIGTGIAPDFVLSDVSHDFGVVPLDSSATWTMQITNAGSATGILQDANVPDPAFQFDLTLPQTLAPNESLEAPLHFTPEEAGIYNTTMTLTTSYETSYDIELSGVGGEVDINLSETDHYFGQVEVGQSAEWTLKIYNPGQLPLQIEALTTQSDVFTVEAPVNLPQTIAAGDSLSAMMAFTPPAIADFSDVLTIVSNSANHPELLVPIWGSGVGLSVEGSNGVPTEFTLLAAYPNPFAAHVVIPFDTPHSAFTEITIYSITGQRVKMLAQRDFNPGRHEVTWNGRNTHEQTVSEGVYLCILKARNDEQIIRHVEKLVMIR